MQNKLIVDLSLKKQEKQILYIVIYCLERLRKLKKTFYLYGKNIMAVDNWYSEHEPIIIFYSVSYTHLTLPTICSV